MLLDKPPEQESYSVLIAMLENLQEETSKTPMDEVFIEKSLNNIIRLWQQILQEPKTDSVKILAEINRALRLLETDWLILRSSRRTDTTRVRLSTLQKRLDQVISYCKLMRPKNE